MFLDIIHRPVYISEHNISETGFCLPPQVKPTQLGPIDRASSYLWTRRRWADNIKMDLRDIGWDGMDWIDLTQDRDQWKALVNKVRNLRVP
jgi:hypothetical protein